MREGFATLPDGRSLAYAEYGDPDGPPVIFCHGSPGCRYDCSDEDQMCRVANVRLLVPDRPGYGKSTPRPNRTLVDWADDVALLSDHLGLNRFVVAGASGGGPHALACAHRLPARVRAALIFCSPAPTSFEGVRKPKSLGNRIGTWLSGTKILPKLIEHNVRTYRAHPDRFYDSVVKAMAPEDRAYLVDPEFRSAALRSLEEAYAQGAAGNLGDACAYSEDRWGFEPAEISVPTFIWQGDLDRLVSPSMAEALHKRIPGSHLSMICGAGHLLTERDDVASQVAKVIRSLYPEASRPGEPT